MDWITSRDDRAAWIMWLYGAAGAGKSAIAQSITELCVQRGIPVASFFFFRTDPTRNNIYPLVATLAYQLALICPASRNIIVRVIDHDPLIFNRSLEHQFEQLIVSPLRQTGRLSSSTVSNDTPLLVLIDGLDECNDRDVQITLVRMLSYMSASRNIPLLFLLASRRESHLKMIFNASSTTRVLTRLALDYKYLPYDDIRLFLDDKFTEIRDTHPLRHLLDPAWPAPHLVDDIAEKSSGQFIYAAMTINYVSSSRGHPAHRLEVCRGLRTARLDTPFAQLDALYRQIFSEVQDIDATRPVLAKALYHRYLEPRWNRSNIFFDMEDRENVESCMSDLSSVITCFGKTRFRVKFLHASLPDFLCDPDRSGAYYMDPGLWCAYLALLFFQVPEYSRNMSHLVEIDLLTRASPTSQLRMELVNCMPENWLVGRSYYNAGLIVYGLLSAVKTMDVKDGGETYRRFFSRIAPCVKTHFPRLYPKLLQDHAPVSKPIFSKFLSVFPLTIKNWSSRSTGSEKSEGQNELWGIVEHQKYVKKLQDELYKLK